jgi:hypothetical protein
MSTINGTTELAPGWSSIMPIIFDLLYREFCRARLAEMQKQLLFGLGTPVVPEEICKAGHSDDDAESYQIRYLPSSPTAHSLIPEL